MQRMDQSWFYILEENSPMPFKTKEFSIGVVSSHTHFDAQISFGFNFVSNFTIENSKRFWIYHQPMTLVVYIG